MRCLIFLIIVGIASIPYIVTKIKGEETWTGGLFPDNETFGIFPDGDKSK